MQAAKSVATLLRAAMDLAARTGTFWRYRERVGIVRQETIGEAFTRASSKKVGQGGL